MDKDLISEATEAIDLLDIHLYSGSLVRQAEIYASNFPDGMKQLNSLSLEIDFLVPENDEAPEDLGLMRVRVTFGLKYCIEEIDKEPLILSEVEACFAATYEKKKEVSEAAIQEFAKFNVVHNVWPFWREHAFRVSREALLPSPIIQLFKSHENG